MNSIDVRIKQISPQSKVPQYATDGSAGLDLCACLEADVEVKSGERVKIPTGLAIQLPGVQVVALVCARSGLAAKYGLTLTNGVGVVDSDYRGEIQVLLTNTGNDTVIIHQGDRIAQLLFVPVCLAKLSVVEDLDLTERGNGGFGSTGT